MQIGKNIYLPESSEGKITSFIFPLKIAMSSGGDKDSFQKVQRKFLLILVKII